MTGDFTPFGFLRSPGHRATSWHTASGGNLVTSTAFVGIEWAYPVARDATRRVGLSLETVVDGRSYRTRADFDTIGLTSLHHTCLVFGFDWQVDGLHVEARYFLVGDDALCLRLSATNRAPASRSASLRALGCVDGQLSAAPPGGRPWRLSESPGVHCVVGQLALEAELAPGSASRLTAVLSHGPNENAALAAGTAALASADLVFARLLDEDARFVDGCPSLSGDWPAHWREGLVYDFETTRLLVQPAGGIFEDVWPSWMAGWPRVVLAEGVLDMLRLAYADPGLAQRAVLSLFRDAPRPNIPCVFQGGEYNMVAADGCRCGTSPAWCLPFLNLELLYLRTLDRQWLAQLYPYVAALLSWWLEHRVDADGWLVYKCTWEAGEDGNPRLDPTATGDADISRRVRPVELQATTSHAAGVLAFFAGELGLANDAQRWRGVQASYRSRTRQLFDPAAGHYRDWLIDEERFQTSSGDQRYWGVDPLRYSAQSLTPLLIGEPLDEAEVWRHACPPWTIWPSWMLSLVESAAAAGLVAEVGRLVCETVDRVYRVTTRRELGSLSRPLPGGAPEFWPVDWRTYAGHDAYGWGATTANLLIRHLFGFKESRRTDAWVVQLAPALPQALLQAGKRFAIRKLRYRGLIFDLTYVVEADGLTVELDLGSQPRDCSVSLAGAAADAQQLYASSRPAARHQFSVHMAQAYTVRLT